MHKVEYETIHAVVNIHGSELQSTIQSIGTIQSTALQVIQSQSGGSVDRLIPSRNDHTIPLARTYGVHAPYILDGQVAMRHFKHV